MVNYDKRTYRLTGMTDLLGSQPASDKIRTEYIASKAPDESYADEEGKMMTLDEKGLTVFLREPETGHLIMLDYQVRAFFKGAFQAMANQLKIKQVRHKVDQFLFVEPRIIPITKNDQPIIDEDGIFERSLRIEMMNRTALAASEMIKAPWQITFDVCLLPNSATSTSNSIIFDAIENALDYGRFQGLGQWRSGGYGRFTWERINAESGDHSEAIERRRKAECGK